MILKIAKPPGTYMSSDCVLSELREYLKKEMDRSQEMIDDESLPRLAVGTFILKKSILTDILNEIRRMTGK